MAHLWICCGTRVSQSCSLRRYGHCTLGWLPFTSTVLIATLPWVRCRRCKGWMCTFSQWSSWASEAYCSVQRSIAWTEARIYLYLYYPHTNVRASHHFQVLRCWGADWEGQCKEHESQCELWFTHSISYCVWVSKWMPLTWSTLSAAARSHGQGTLSWSWMFVDVWAMSMHFKAFRSLHKMAIIQGCKTNLSALRIAVSCLLLLWSYESCEFPLLCPTNKLAFL